MKTKSLVALSLAATMAISLTACGSSAATTTTSDTAASTAPAAEATAETATETTTDAAATDGGSLVYWSMWSEGEPQAQIIKSATEKFTADTGITVDVEFKGRSGQREGLQPALDAGQTIDVFDEDVNRVNGTWGKYLLPLEDLAKDYESEHGNTTLFAIARNAYAQANDGDTTLHSIPYQPSIFGLFYNQTLFDKAGVSGVPQTWDELDAACQKLVDAGITPITADDAYMTCIIGYQLARYLGQDGVKSLVTGEAVNGTTCTWSDAGVLSAAKDIEDFSKKGYFSANISTNAYPVGQNQEFAIGDAAIIPCGSWLPNECKDYTAEDLKWGYMNFPTVDGGKDDRTANNIANQVFAINKDTKMADEAFQYIAYLTSGDVDAQFVSDAMCIPVDKANSDTWPTELAAVKTDFDATTTYYDWACGVESNADITGDIKDNTIKLCAGTLDAQGFVDAMKSVSGQ